MDNLMLRAQQVIRGLREGERTRARYTSAILGDGNGNVDASAVHGKPWVYARLYANPDVVIEVFNNSSVPMREDVAVDLERVRYSNFSFYRVVGISASITYNSATIGPGTAAATVGHAAQHERDSFGQGGFDPLDVHPRALTGLRGRAQATPDWTAYVECGLYVNSTGAHIWLGGNSPAVTPLAWGWTTPRRRCDLLYIGADDALHWLAGVETVDGSAPTRPGVPADAVVICWVYLDGTQSALTESAIYDPGHSGVATPPDWLDVLAPRLMVGRELGNMIVVRATGTPVFTRV